MIVPAMILPWFRQGWGPQSQKEQKHSGKKTL